jgi:glycosyltransferase involved in cell wall biosynthesis
MQASVIIPSYNRADALELTLSALAEQTLPPSGFEAIVVDDGSTDRSIKIASEARFAYSLRAVQQANRGAGAARNRGAQEARTDLFVFLDVDVIPSPQLVEEYLVADERHRGALIVGRQQPWPKANYGVLDRMTQHEWFRDLGPEPLPLEFYHVLSSNMSISAASFRKLGGFDEGVGTGAHPATDDTDFGYRAQKLGLDLIHWPHALAYHNHPRSLEQRCAQTRTIAFWTARMYQRYPEMWGSIPVFRDIEPVSWRSDPWLLVAKKSSKRLLGASPVPGLLKCMVGYLVRQGASPRLVKFLYWRVLSAYRVAGFRTGLGSKDDKE